MNYLVTFIDGSLTPFLTKWFEYDNHWVEGMVVFDLSDNTYTIDGKDWRPIEENHL
jgi:hypothetical protein